MTQLQHKIKIGRPARFENAEQLWTEALEYFAWCDNNPIKLNIRAKMKKSSKNGDAAEQDQQTVQRPYTLDGLCVYLNLQTEWSVFKANHKKRKDWDEFNMVIQACEQVVRDRQVTGAMIGLYSERLTARLNGITDKVDATVNNRNATVSWEDFQKMLRGEEV